MTHRADWVERLRVAAVATIVAVLGLVAVMAGVIWGLDAWLHQPTGEAITGKQYNSVAPPTTRSQALRRLGRPMHTVASGQVAPYPESGFGPIAAGTSGDYYEEADTLTDGGVMRFCYRTSDATLVEKAAYDMGAGVDGGTELTTACVWTITDPHPECR